MVGGIENEGESMPRTRKSHPPSLKAKVAVEAIKAHKTTAQIAHMFGVLCFANIRSACNRLTARWMERKNRTHAGLLIVDVSIPPTPPQRPSGSCHREHSAPNANSGISAKKETPGSDDLGPGVLGYSPQPVVRLATSPAVCPGRHGREMATRTVPKILGAAVEAAPSWTRSSRHRHKTPSASRTNGRGQSVVARPGFTAS